MWALLTFLAAAGAASMAIWSRKDTKARALAMALFLAAGPLAAMTMFSSMSHPAPFYEGITVPEGQWELLFVDFTVYEAIYILLDTPGHPRWYELKWDEKLAGELNAAMGRDGARGEGDPGGTFNIRPYDHSWDKNEPQFLPSPQPMQIPPKSDDAPEVPLYDRGT